jgi:translation initiation factor IF-3
VRLVASDGQQVGITPLPEALQMARDLDLDLVEVAPLANPPVCRIMDYGKYKYEEAQRARESRRKSSAVAIKEMKYRPKIGIGDFDTKTRKVSEFLAEGHKVKVTIMFRGREVFHPELGKKILDQVAERVMEVGKVEAAPRLDGRNMTMVLAPDKRAQAKRSTTHRDAAPAPGPTATASQPTAPQPTATAPAPAATAPVPSAPSPSAPAEPEAVVVADSEAAPTA